MIGPTSAANPSGDFRAGRFSGALRRIEHRRTAEHNIYAHNCGSHRIQSTWRLRHCREQRVAGNFAVGRHQRLVDNIRRGAESSGMDPDARRNQLAWQAASEKHVREYEEVLGQARSGSSLFAREARAH